MARPIVLLKPVCILRCLRIWRTFWSPYSEWRWQNPRPLWDVGAYTTAFGMFQLYPIILNTRGVIRDWALLRVFKESMVAGNR